MERKKSAKIEDLRDHLYYAKSGGPPWFVTAYHKTYTLANLESVHCESLSVMEWLDDQ